VKLSQVETEALRSLRTRLNKAPTSDAASATLGRVFFQVLARSELEPQGEAAAVFPALRDLLDGVGRADMGGLRRCLATLHPRLGAPAEWRKLQGAGVPQAVISRRLQLAGREPDPQA
jgi:hypothetical protein